MQRYFIQLSYKGTVYCGWQKQPNGITVQEEVEKSLALVIGEKTDVLGCGRTDSGVHSNDFYLHFDVEKKMDPNTLVYRLNSILPNSIAIKKVFKVHENAHARFDASSRTYRYYINHLKKPFETDTSWYLYNTKLDVGKMNQAAELLLKVNDFSAFEKVGSDNSTSICKVKFAEWFKNQDEMYFEIRADRFLRNMVRAIVGTLIEIGKEKIDINEFKTIIESKDRSNSGASVPAKGLFLWEVTYPLSIRK